MRIPEDKLEEVRAASDIVTVVQGYVALKRRGQNHWGLCPFHSETAPSFAVNVARQIYRCFGCGRGGNVFTFLMELERVSFVEAVRLLAERAGIELPKPRRDESEEPSESELLVRANTLARDFFFHQLTNSPSPGAREARDYLQARGYGTAVIERFLLGYAPDAWDALFEHARSAGIPQGILLRAGLLKEGRDSNRPYDAFRHRIMFPIRNLSGRVIAFGGRRLRDDDEREGAKYINSPETSIYHKGRELFGLYEARNDVRTRDQAVLVEGYTDCLSLVMAGVPIAVASMGTSLTEHQTRLLKRYTPNVFILYDGDDAGLNAARRAADVLIGEGLTPRAVVLPEGEDPDTFVRRAGGEAVWKAVHEALSLVELHLLLAGRRQKPPAVAAREMVSTIALVRSPVEQDVLLQETAQKTGISLDALRRELGRTRGPVRPPAETPSREKWPPEGVVSRLAEVLIRQPDVRTVVFEKWQPEAAEDPRLKNVLQFLYDEWKTGEMREPERLLDRFPEPPERDFIVGVLDVEAPAGTSRQIEIDHKLARDFLRAIEAARVRDDIAKIKRQMKASPERAETLGEQLRALVEQQRALQER